MAVQRRGHPKRDQRYFVHRERQEANVGSYDVIVSNFLGSVTSSSATLNVTILSVDINARTNDIAAATMPGFSSFTIGVVGGAVLKQTNASVRTYGPYTVTLTGNGPTDPGYVDRWRFTPTNTPPTFTTAQLLQDFVFSQNVGTDAGLNVALDGLVPGRTYTITVWSYDTGSVRPRISDWFANGTLLLDNYMFDGTTNQPSSDSQFRFTLSAVASPSGQILIQGRRDSSTAAADPAVFLNALQVVTAPATLPSIVTQPVGSTVYAGDNPPALRASTAGGTAPFVYQWYRGTTAVSGATNTVLAMTNVAVADGGNYTFVVSNILGSVTSSVATVTVLPVANIRTALASYWPLNTIGASTPDIIAANHFGPTNMDASNLTAAQCAGKGLTLNGTDEYLVRYASNSVGLPAYSSPSYTVAFWVKGNGTNQNDRRIFAEGSSLLGNNPIFDLGTGNGLTNGSIDVFIRNDNGTTVLNHRQSTNTALDGNWHHVAWVDNNGQAKLYIDGVLDIADFNYTRGVLTANATAVGALVRAAAGNFFAGSVDNVAIWRRALSAAEVALVKTVGPAPAIVLNGAATMTNECHTAFTDPGVAVDSCDSGVTVNVTGGLDTNTVGTYVLTYTATDTQGGVATTTRTVKVSDTLGPVITVNGPLVITIECHTTSYSDAGATAFDACMNTATAVNTSGSVNVNAPGSYPITYTSTDTAGNTSTKVRTVNVVDTTPPVITLNGDNPTTIECHTSYSEAGGRVTDTCAGFAPATVSGSVNVNVPGTYTLTYTATDPSGNSSSTTRTVIVRDTIAPVVTLSGSSTVIVECHGTYTEAGATANDSCAGSRPVTIGGGPVNPNVPSTNVLTYTATDPSGNSTTVNRTVMVRDTIGPVITLNGAATITLECHAAYTEQGASANDACAGAVAVTTNGTVNVDQPGTNIVTYTSADGNGNTSTKTRTVIIRDTAAPVITISGANPATVECHTSYTDMGAMASDACAGPVSVSSSGGVNVNVPGSYTITYTANDGNGNTNTATRTVNVVDTIAPTLNCPADQRICTSSNSAVATFTTTAFDACAGSITVTYSAASGSSFPLGTNIVTIKADDGNGNTNICTFKVVVFKAVTPTMTNLSYSGGSFQFDFASELGCTYVVESRNGVGVGSWATVTTVTGDGTVKHITDTPAGGVIRLYRIRVQ